jgi:hypothetical protein
MEVFLRFLKVKNKKIKKHNQKIDFSESTFENEYLLLETLFILTI